MSRETDTELIRRARLASDLSTKPFRDRYLVNWTFADLMADRRSGRIHAWTAASRYLGRFTTHRKAVQAGADVTRVGSDTWFTWDMEHEWRKPAKAGKRDVKALRNEK